MVREARERGTHINTELTWDEANPSRYPLDQETFYSLMQRLRDAASAQDARDEKRQDTSDRAAT